MFEWKHTVTKSMQEFRGSIHLRYNQSREPLSALEDGRSKEMSFSHSPANKGGFLKARVELRMFIF